MIGGEGRQRGRGGPNKRARGGRKQVAGPARYNAAVAPEQDLPGADLVAAGLSDLAEGVESVAALLVSIGAPRLEQLGLCVPNPIPSPERRLYERLHAENPDAAHSRYNAYLRRLVSYERALACVKSPTSTASSD